MSNHTEQPEDLRAVAIEVADNYIIEAQKAGVPFVDTDRMVDDMLRLCEAAALAALPKRRTIDNDHDYNDNYVNKGWNQAIITAQANIHSVFGGTGK